MDRKEIIQWMLVFAFLANLAAYEITQNLLTQGFLEANPLYGMFGLKIEPSLVLLAVIIVVAILYKVAVRSRRTETRAIYGFIVGLVLAFTIGDLVRDLAFFYGLTGASEVYSFGLIVVLAVAIGAYASMLMIRRAK